MVAGPGFQQAFPTLSLFKRPITVVDFDRTAHESSVANNAANKSGECAQDQKRRKVCAPLNLTEWSAFAPPAAEAVSTEECCIEGCQLPKMFGTALCQKHGEVSSPSSTRTHSSGSSQVFSSSVPARSGSARLCEVESCYKSAQGRTARCKAHGGGKRCISPNCTKSAQGSTDYCKAHGGGKRCKSAGCTKAARGSTDHCIAHGGGKRCVIDGCSKSAVGSTSHCVKHGGGRRCTVDICTKSARGGSMYCAKHGTQERKRVAAETHSHKQPNAPIQSTLSAPSLLDASVLLGAAAAAHPIQPQAQISPINALASAQQLFGDSNSSALLAAATIATTLLQQKQQQQQQQQLLELLTGNSGSNLASLQATLALLNSAQR